MRNTTFYYTFLLSPLLLTNLIAKVHTDFKVNTSQKSALEECYEKHSYRLELNSCFTILEAKSRQSMSDTYKKLKQEISDIDSSNTSIALASLERSQKIFEKFLKAQCRFEGDFLMSGTGAGDAQYACEIDLIRARTKKLLNFINYDNC